MMPASLQPPDLRRKHTPQTHKPAHPHPPPSLPNHHTHPVTDQPTTPTPVADQTTTPAPVASQPTTHNTHRNTNSIAPPIPEPQKLPQ